jgi:quinol monooxygenase YgiN
MRAVNKCRRGIVAMVFVAAAVSMQAAPQDAAPLRYEKLPDGVYAVVAEVRSKPGKEDELRRATLPLVAKVRNEPNNLLYFLHEDREAPGHFVFYEIFASRKDFEAHNNTAHVQAWFARLPELADGGVKVIHMGILGNRPIKP